MLGPSVPSGPDSGPPDPGRRTREPPGAPFAHAAAAVPLLDRIRLGKSGENVACRELRRRGYEILARRFRTRFGEIDIVARDAATIAFVEVKTRRTGAFGTPAEAVGPWKQHKVWLMASDYLSRRGWQDRPCRFDVVAISIDRDGRRSVDVFKGAFDAPASP